MPIAFGDTSGLTKAQYGTLSDLRDGAAYQIVMQRISFDWDTLIASGESVAFDACSDGDDLWLAYQDGGIVVGRFSENAWPVFGTISDDVSIFSIVAKAAGGARVFWYSGGKIYYADTSNLGSPTLLTALSSVAHLAATSESVLHIVTYDGHNSRFHVWNGSLVSSDMYWPGTIESLDALSIQAIDTVIFASRGQKRYTDQRQGVWWMQQGNGRWSDPDEIDVLDEYSAGVDQRVKVKLSQVNGIPFATYVAYDASQTLTCFSRTLDGRHWEHRQPLGAAISYPVVMLALGNNVYAVGCNGLQRSPSTPLSGLSTVETDITSAVVGYNGSRQRMWQSNIVISNEPPGDLLPTFDARMGFVERLGYWNGDTPLLQQIALTEVDRVSRAHDLPVNVVKVVARDRLAWMEYTEADHYEEWVSQLRHYDNFANSLNPLDGSEINYSGLRHTATYTGNWSTEDNTLKVISNRKDALALTSVSKFIGHTIHQGAFQLPATAEGDAWAGLVVRALDQYNLWCAYYDEASDRIRLRQMLSGEWQTYAAQSASAMGWTTETWYWLRVEVRLQRFRVYHSTDGQTWTLAIDYVDNSESAEIAAFREGYVGWAGYGYSDEDFDPEEPEPTTPPTGEGGGIPEYVCTTYTIVGTNEHGVFYTANRGAASPDWEPLNGGLSSPGKIRDMKFAPWDGHALYMCCDAGVYKYSDLPSYAGTWELMHAAPHAAPADTYYNSICFDPDNEGHMWVSYGNYAYANAEFGVIWTDDDWDTYDGTSIWDDETAYSFKDTHLVGNIVRDPATGHLWTACSSHNWGDYLVCVFKSEDGGETWTDWNELDYAEEYAEVCSVYIPRYNNPNGCVFWARDGGTVETPIRYWNGTAWADFTESDTHPYRPRKFIGPMVGVDRIEYLSSTGIEVYTKSANDLTWHLYASGETDVLPFTRTDNVWNIVDGLLGRNIYIPPYTNIVKQFDDEGNLTDKTGDFAGESGSGVTCIAKIAREGLW